MSNHPDWTAGFFTGLVAETVRRIPNVTDAEADFLQRHLLVGPGAHLLDAPCGNGRLSAALADRGFELTGIDSSAELLNDANSSIGKRRMRFENRDMRKIADIGPFDAAFCAGNSFAYFDDAGNEAFLSGIAKVLKPGGRFSLETRLVAECVFVHKLQRAWFPLGDILFLVDTEYDPLSGYFTSHYTILHDDTVERRDAIYRVYTARELIAMAEGAGFRVEHAFGSLKGEPFTLGSPGLWLILQRI